MFTKETIQRAREILNAQKYGGTERKISWQEAMKLAIKEDKAEEIIFSMNYGGSRPYNQEETQIKFIPKWNGENFEAHYYKKVSYGSAVSGEKNAKGELIPYIGEWEKIDKRIAYQYLDLNSKDYVPVEDWHMLLSKFDIATYAEKKEVIDFISKTKEHFGNKRLLAIQPLTNEEFMNTYVTEEQTE